VKASKHLLEAFCQMEASPQSGAFAQRWLQPVPRLPSNSCWCLVSLRAEFLQSAPEQTQTPPTPTQHHSTQTPAWSPTSDSRGSDKYYHSLLLRGHFTLRKYHSIITVIALTVQLQDC